MKKVVLLLIAVLFVFSGTLVANNKIEQDMIVEVTTSGNKLHGVVLDKLTNESLAGVAISVGNQKVYTDLDGNFTLNYASNSTYELKISMISYQEQVLVVDAKAKDQLKIELSQR